MYGFPYKFRGILRCLGVIAAVAITLAIAFVSILPFLIDGHTVREGFVRSLSTWSGGPVIVDGPLRIASFAKLTIEADGVSLTPMGRLSQIAKVETKSIKAVARISSLLRGKLEFKRVVVTSPKFVFKRDAFASPAGVKIAELAAALAYGSPFQDIEFVDPAFFVPAGNKRPFRRFQADQVEFGKDAAASKPVSGSGPKQVQRAAVRLYVRDRGFEGVFRGEVSRTGDAASGFLRLNAPLDHPTTGKITEAILPWEHSRPVSLMGDLNWSKGRVALEHATLKFGDRTAKGSLALAVKPARALLEGTLAYDLLDLSYLVTGQGEKVDWAGTPAGGAIRAKPFEDRGLDFDIRISAERLSAGPFEAGPLAIALNVRGGRFSVDVAELALFGGSVKGRLDYNPDSQSSLSVNLSGSRVEALSLARAFNLPVDMSGPATIQAGLAVPIPVRAPEKNLDPIAGKFSVKFPAGGTLGGEMSRRLGAVLTRQGEPLFGTGVNSVSFSEASIDGAIGRGGMDLTLDGKSSKGHLTGLLRLDFPGSRVSGNLTLSKPGDRGDTQTSADARLDTTNFILSGTPAALDFATPGKTSLSH